MKTSVEAPETGRAETWPTTGADAVMAAADPSTLTASADNIAAAAAPDPTSAARAFEACCRALSHKANTTLVAQLPLLQNGTVIDLTRNYVGAAGLQAIAVVLPHNPHVTELRAPRNGLTNDAVVIFCRAMRGHARLAVLDFSCNTDVSLAGGLALLSLAQQVPSLRIVQLDGTHVPPVVLSKLKRALEMNAARGRVTTTATAAASTTAAKGAVVTTATRQLLSSMPTTATAQTSPYTATTFNEATSEAQHEKLVSALAARVRAAVSDGYRLPPAVPSTGWRELEVPILAPPFLFETEIELLCTSVFPRLNEEFATHRLLLRPVVVVSGAESTRAGGTAAATASGKGNRGPPAPRTIGSYHRELRFVPACDVVSTVVRGRFAAIELVGDRPGDYAQVSAAAMLSLQQHCDTSAVYSSSRPTTTMTTTEEEEKEEKRDAVGSADGLGVLQPVLYEAHEAALRSTQWLLVATRRETRSLHAPAAFAPLLTAEPSVAHPDRHRTVVRDIVYDDALAVPETDPPRRGTPDARTNASTAVARTLEWDYSTEEHLWKRHVAWRRHVVSSAPVGDLVLPQYSATFDCTDASGAVRLKDLETFEAGIYHRLRTVVRACLDARSATDHCDGAAGETGMDDGETSDDVHNLFYQVSLMKVWGNLYAQSIAGLSSGASKKNVMNRIVLYAANPPSRNSLLLHSHDVTALLTLMCRAASRLQSLQHAYTLALCSTRLTAVQEEPSDVRGFVVQIVSQLTTDAAVLRYVHAEVDTERLCSFFLQILSGTVRTAAKSGSTSAMAVITAAGLPGYVAQYTLGAPSPDAEGHKNGDAKAAERGGEATAAHAFVVVADGLDKLAQPVRPCGALVYGAGGANRAEPANWSDENNNDGHTPASAPPFLSKSGAGGEAAGSLDGLLPRALARNVRFIASCTTDSSVFDALRHLGRDSVETLSLGPVSANEVEQHLSPAILSRFGLTFSEDDFECARAKKDAAMGEYMRYLQDAARGAHEAPGFLTQSQVIQAFPPTTADAAQEVYDRLVRAFGLPLTRNVLGLLTASRWGLTVPELRALLPQLPARRLQELLRLLRPVLEPEASAEASAVMGFASGNAQLGSLRIVVPSFLDVVHREALQVMTDEQQIDADQRVWHGQLAQYYLSVVYRCLQTQAAEKKAEESGTTATTTPRELSSRRPELRVQQRRAMKEVLHHMTQNGAFWPQLDAIVLSLPFLQLVYQLGLGYAYLRDLTVAFNERYQRHLLGEDIGEASWQRTQPAVAEVATSPSTPTKSASDAVSAAGHAEASRYALPAVLIRMRDYVRFAHDHGLRLSLRPSLVAQTALQVPASALNSVQRDAVTFLYRQLLQPQELQLSDHSGRSLRQVLYFTTSTGAAATGKSAATHLGSVTCAVYLPNRRFIVSASRDRSLAWVNPQTGTVVWHARQPTAPVESLTVCRTSTYVAAVSADRKVWIYDGLQGKLVTQCRGGEWFDAPITAVVFSARGRYVWVVTADTRARCFECETGRLRCSLGMPELLEPAVNGETGMEGSESPKVSEWRHRRNYLSVLPDPVKDEICTTVAAQEVRQWELHPWKTASLAETAVAEENNGKEDALVACDMTAHCRLLINVLPLKTTASIAQPEGYRWILPWETTAVPPQVGKALQSVYAFALPVAFPSEVHLLALPMETLDGKTTAAAARCVFTAPLPDDEVVVARASPDGKWLAVAMASGRVGLFDVSSAYQAWAAQQKQGWSSTDNTAGPSSIAVTVECAAACVYSSLMPVSGMVSAPIRTLAFHRDNRLLFALGHTLKCWRVPVTVSDAAEETTVDVGEYAWAQSPTCLTVLPPPAALSSDVELPSATAELCVGDETGRLTLLKLWKPSI